MTIQISKPYGFLLDCIKQHRWLLAGQALVALFFSIDLSLRPYVLKLMIDSIGTFSQTPNLEVLIKLAIIYICLSLWMSLAYRFNDYIWLRLSPRLKKYIGYVLINRMMMHSHQFYQENFTGSLSNKIKDVMSSVPDLFKIIMQQFLGYALTPVVATIALYQVNPVIAASLLVWWCFFIALNMWSAKKGASITHSFAEARSAVVGSIVDIIGNMMSVRLFSAKSYELEKLSGPLNKYAKKDEELQWFWLKVMTAQGLSFIAYLSWCLFLLIKSYKTGKATPGDFAMVMTINITIIEFLWNFSRDIAAAVQAFGTITQGLRLALAPVAVADKPNAKTLLVTSGRVEYKAVCFEYDNSPSIFINKSIVIDPGQKVGLVGYSGSGKTTFINLILRLYDISKGQILIDGQDIASVTQESLHATIGVIPQDASLFHRTLMENIRYGKIDASDQEVIQAAQKAHAHDFISQLAQGYDSLVGERGVKLSGGQRQRIAIARAMLKNAPILLLDEATSQLDSLTEQFIQDSLSHLMQDKTTIVIAHRLSTLLCMNRILVFDRGKIVQDGTHKELLAQSGTYKTLWDAQVGGFLPDSKEQRGVH